MYQLFVWSFCNCKLVAKEVIYFFKGFVKFRNSMNSIKTRYSAFGQMKRKGEICLNLFQFIICILS